jgi:hypothetical protein
MISGGRIGKVDDGGEWSDAANVGLNIRIGLKELL